MTGNGRLAWRLGGLLALTAAAVGCAGAHSLESWDGFQAGNWPGATWRPYADRSPFNEPVGRAAVDPHSTQLVAAALQWGAPASMTVGTAGTAEDYGHPVYYARRHDPLYVLHATEPWGRSSIQGMRIPVPPGASPAGGGDHHMTIVTPDGWEYDLWHANPPSSAGHALTFGWGGRTRIYGNGLDSPATAAHFAGLAGVIRPEELAAGRIDHALFIVLRCTGAGTRFGYGVRESRRPSSSSYVYPARAGGNTCSARDPNLPPMGARFRLAMSRSRIEALPFPSWKKAVLLALAEYGGYVGDTGGPGFAFQLQSGSTYTSFGAPDRFVQLARTAGISPSEGRYSFDIGSGVEWSRYLQVLAPPTR